MNQPQNLPDLLQARLKLGLFNWGKRTITWTLALGLLSAIAPAMKVFLIAWLLFSALSLAALLLGLKLARNFKAGTAAAFPQSRNQPRDVGGPRPEPLTEEVYPTHQAHTGRNGASDEIIEIEAEVLPPEHR